MINGHALRVIRTYAGLTQPELAKRAGLSKQVICDIEHGRRGGSAPTARALADALRIPLLALMSEGDTPSCEERVSADA